MPRVSNPGDKARQGLSGLDFPSRHKAKRGRTTTMRLHKSRVLDELADLLVALLDRKFAGDGCSFFAKEEGSVGRFRLVASTKLTRFIGIDVVDAFDKAAVNALPVNLEPGPRDGKELQEFGLTKYTIRHAMWKGKGCVSSDVANDTCWSGVLRSPRPKGNKPHTKHCEVEADNLLSFMAAPLIRVHVKSRQPKEGLHSHDVFGLVRIVRARCAKDGSTRAPYTIADLRRLEREVKKVATLAETAISASYLASLGHAAIRTKRFWQDVIEKLTAMVDGTGASVFELDDSEKDQNYLKYVCRATTGLYDKNDNWIGSESEMISRGGVFYRELRSSIPESLTMWVAKNRGNVVVRQMGRKKEYEEYAPVKREPGRGLWSEHLDDASVIMAPVMSLDNRRVTAVIRVAKERSQSKTRKVIKEEFSPDQVKLFLSVIPAISQIFVTSRRLELLDNLIHRSIREVDDINHLYRKVVEMVPELVKAPGCTLLVKSGDSLCGRASSAPHIQKMIDDGRFKPYLLGQAYTKGYTAWVAKTGRCLMFNNPTEDKGEAKWSDRSSECEVGENIPTCERFLAVPVLSLHTGDPIGVIRTAKMLYHDPFTLLDRILLQEFADRLSFAIEEVERQSRERKERKETIERTFSPFLVRSIRTLEHVAYAEDIRGFLNHLERSSGDIRDCCFDRLSEMWIKWDPTLPVSFSVARELHKFESNILGDVPGYRDHFIHQLTVFLIGTHIIDRLQHEDMLPSILGKQELENGWIITANFHDMANAVALIDEWLPAVVNVLLRKADRIVTPTRFLNILVDIQERYYVYLDRMKKALGELDTGQMSFVVHSLTRLGGGDHGLLSALSLQKNARRPNDKLVTTCALAIALHTMALKDSRRQLSPLGLKRVPFSRLPLAFLLLYCDNLHEWARDLSSSSIVRDVQECLRDFDMTVGWKTPGVLRSDKSLMKETKAVGQKVLYVHSEVFVPAEKYLLKKDRLKEVFEVIESSNPLFSVRLNGANETALFNSLTHVPWEGEQ